MNDFTLDTRLARDGILLGELELSLLLLMNNALVPWFILVPRVEETELYRLTPAQQQTLFGEINRISRFVREELEVHKLNVASLGNVVAQLHIHIVGRRRDDFCWPQPVWGQAQAQAYTSQQVEAMRARLERSLAPPFTTYGSL